MCGPIQKTKSNEKIEINTQAHNQMQEDQLQENLTGTNNMQLQAEQNIDINQNAELQEEEFEYKGYVIKKPRSADEQAEEKAAVFQKTAVTELRGELFDLVFSGLDTSLRQDRGLPGGTMESADYIFMQERKIQTKLEQSDHQNRKNKYNNVAGFDQHSEKSWNKQGMTFKKFIFTDKLQETLRNVDLTDEKKVKAARAQLKEAMEKCDAIMNPVYQQKSDQIFKHSRENKDGYEEKLKAYNAELKEEADALNALLDDTCLNRQEAEEKVLGGSALLYEKHESTEYILRDRDKLTVPKKAKATEKVKEYLREEEKLKEQLAQEEKKVGKARSEKQIKNIQKNIKTIQTNRLKICEQIFTYKWNPEEILKKAKQNPEKVTMDKDGNAVEGERTTATAKEMLDFAKAIRNSMLNQLVDYCTKKFGLSEDEEGKESLTNQLRTQLIEKDGFAKIDIFDATLKTEDGGYMTAKWDISCFTQSPAVQQMQSLCDYAEKYGTLLNEKPFHELAIYRIDMLGEQLKRGITMMEGSFQNIDKEFDEILKKNSIEAESAQEDPIEKTHDKMVEVLKHKLETPKYTMTNSKLYAFYRGFISTLRDSVINKGYGYANIEGDVIRQNDISLNIVPEQIKKLNAAYKTINRMIEGVIADYAEKKGLDHEENPEGGATVTKKFSVEDIAKGGAAWDELKNEPLWSLYHGVYVCIRDAVNEINHYKDDVEEYGIKKDAQVGEYYANVKDVYQMLKDCDTNLENSAMSGDIAKTYKEVMELQQELTALREDELNQEGVLQAGRKHTEAEMIAKGRRIYIALAKCNALSDNLALRRDFIDNIQGRNIFKMVNSLKMGIYSRLAHEKKEELACYEGSLLRKEMSVLMNEGMNKKDVTVREQVMEMVDTYSQLKDKMDIYLKRYADIKESCYYVKNLELSQESFNRQIKELSGKVTVSLCDEVTKEMELDKKLQLEHFNENNGKRLKEMAAKTDKMGNSLNAQETEDWLNMVFDMYVASESFAKAGMNADAIMNKMNYPSIRDKEGNYVSPDKWFFSRGDKKTKKEWCKKKVSELRSLYNEMSEKFAQKTGNADKFFRDHDEKFSYIDHLINQTKLGTQLKIMWEMEFGEFLQADPEDKEFLNAYWERAEQFNPHHAKKLGMEPENRELLEKQAVDAYRELKKSTNLETKYDRASARFQEKKGTKIRDALNRLKKANGLITQNSSFFENVMTAATQLETLENNPNVDYAVLKKEYQKVMDAANEYIKARDNWRNAWSDNGKERLAAVKEFKEAVGSTSKDLEDILAASYTALENTKKQVTEKSTKLREFREKMAANKGVSAQDYLIEFRQTFKEELENFDNETITGINAGVDYMADLMAEDMKLHRQGANWILEQTEEIRKECFEKDHGSLSMEEQYKLWAKCYGFYLKYKDQCPKEAKKTLESLEILSRDYVNEADSKELMTAIIKDQEIAKKCAAGTINDEFTMLHLKWKYQKFLKGVDGNLGFFIEGYEQFRKSMDEVSKKAGKKITGQSGTKLLAQARMELDVKLQETRDELAKNNFTDAKTGSQVLGKLRDCLTELTFFEETFGHLRKAKAYDQKENSYQERKEYNTSILNYYQTQKESLEAILASYAVRDIVVSDMNLSFEKDLKRRQDKKAYGTISNVKLSDERLKDINNLAPLEEGSDITYSQYIKFIVTTETERKQLGDLKEMAQIEPEMAEEVQKQTEVKKRFEQYLKTQKDMEPRHSERLCIALQNRAQECVNALEKKLLNIQKEHLGSNEEQLIGYICSLSKRYDEARILVDLANKWAKMNENVNINNSSFARLVKLINYIDREASKAKKQRGFEKIAESMKAQAGDLKMEDARMHYSTQEITKRRDENFAISLRNLGELKFTSLNDMRVNEKVKAERMRYSVESYDKMKVKKNSVFKLFGFRLWGQELFSMDDFITRLEQYAFEYEHSWEMEKKRANMGQNAVHECPLNVVVRDLKLLKELAKRLSNPDKLDEKEIAEIPVQFKKLMGSLDRKFNDACREVIGYPTNDVLREEEKTGKIFFKETGEEYTSEYRKHLEEEEKKLKKGWGQLYGVLRGIPTQVDQYLDRRPSVKKKELNSDLRDNHRLFIRQMSILKASIDSNEAEDVQDKKFFEALRLSRLGENPYAESAMEHNVNMECALYSQYLSSLAESKCFKRSQDTMKKLKEMTPEARQENAGNVYNDFMKYLTRFYLSSGISETFFKSMKEHMDVQMKFYRKKSMDPQELREFQYDVLKEMVQEIEIPQEVPGDSLIALKKEMAEMDRDVLNASGSLMIRCLNMMYLGDKAEKLKLDSEEFLRAAEYLNSSSLWRFILRMYRRITTYWKARNA